MTTTNQIIVADSGPIISLAVIHQLHLLEHFFEKVYIPEAVWNELIYLPEKSEVADIKTIFSDKIIRVSRILNGLNSKVDLGEAEAISLYKAINADFLLIDDKIAREQAEKFDIKCIGSLAVLLKAKELSIVASLRPLFVKLLENKRYFSVKLLNSLLNKMGEEGI